MPLLSDPVNRLIALTLGLFLSIMIGWLMLIGKSLLLPIVIAVLSVYVIASTAQAMDGWRATCWMPSILRKLLLILAFLLVLAAINWVVILTARDLMALAPVYQANLEQLIAQGMAVIGIEGNPDWETIGALTIDRIDMQALIGWLAGSVGSLLAVMLMAAIYALFVAAEASGLAHKLAVALPHWGGAQRTEQMIQAINARIGQYLAVKTLINVIIGTISYAILWVFGVDHALFWALMIGLLNYIPYFGSLVAVTLPVLMTLVQSGSMQLTLVVAFFLTAANMWVGNWLEPRMIGRRVNMSPFVVVAALSFWTAFWGVPGAILAVPLTSMVAIILAGFPQTRPVAVLLAYDVSEFEEPVTAQD